MLGEIDLDPASNDVAQKTAQAKRYFTAADGGTVKEWHGRVWLNRLIRESFLKSSFLNLLAKSVPGAP